MLTKVVRERGVSGLFAGLPATLTSTVPFIGVSWSAFNVGKAQYNTLHGRDPMQKPPVTALLGLGVLSTAAAEVGAATHARHTHARHTCSPHLPATPPHHASPPRRPTTPPHRAAPPPRLPTTPAPMTTRQVCPSRTS
jgi:hypothetical protein